MSVVHPKRGRARIKYEGNETVITIHSKKQVFTLILMFAWLGGWTLGELFVGAVVFSIRRISAESLFFMFWFIGWTIGGAFVIYSFLWGIAGKEVIRISDDSFSITKKVFFLGFEKEYLFSEAKNYRFIDRGISSRSNDFSFVTKGNIAFDYGYKTYTFAQFLDESEANMMINTFFTKIYKPKVI